MKNKGYLIVPKKFRIFEGEGDAYDYRGGPVLAAETCRDLISDSRD